MKNIQSKFVIESICEMNPIKKTSFRDYAVVLIVDEDDQCQKYRQCKFNNLLNNIYYSSLYCFLDKDHVRIKPKEDIEDAVSYINEKQAPKAWVFVKEKETLCYTFYEFSYLVRFCLNKLINLSEIFF